MLSSYRRQWTFAEVVDWFETEGSVFLTSEDGEVVRARVVVSSQIEDDVIRSIWKYLRKLGFHPSFRETSFIMKGGLKRKRAAECELLSNLEQECFLEHALPFLRTEKRRDEVISALSWLRERRKLPGRKFRQFTCPKSLDNRRRRRQTSGSLSIRDKP
jgi:hypothetical protein